MFINGNEYAIEAGADLHGADLHGADLHGADLHGAGLSRADLRGADLSRAIGFRCLGYDARGYHFRAVLFETGWRVTAGCRNFSYEEALIHWANNPDAMARLSIIPKT